MGLSVKRGETLSYRGERTVNLPVGTWAIKSQIRDWNDVLVANLVPLPAELVVTDVALPQIFYLQCDESLTANFPLTDRVQKLKCDVFYINTADNFTKASDTFYIDCNKNVTLP